ncbi:hypothetical protein APSETT445_008446 [Aspergillus pseudonomiae]
MDDRWFIEQAHLLRRLQQRRNFLEQRILTLMSASDKKIPVYLTSQQADLPKQRGKQPRSRNPHRRSPSTSTCREAVQPKLELDEQSQPYVQSNSSLAVRPTHTERSIQSLVEVFSVDVDGRRTVPVWLEQAVQMRSSSPLLCAAIEATSFVLMGKISCDPKSTHSGLVRYTCALRLAGSAICDAQRRLRDDVFVAITLFGMIEILSAISHGRTFLATDDWKTVPWTEASPRSNLHSLLDIAADIPGLWRQMGCTSPSSDSSSSCTSFDDFEYTAEDQATQIIHRLQEWRESQPVHILPEPTEALFTVRDDFPVFETHDSTSGAHRPRDLVYPNVDDEDAQRKAPKGSQE